MYAVLHVGEHCEIWVAVRGPLDDQIKAFAFRWSPTAGLSVKG